MTIFTKFYLFFTSLQFFNTHHPERVTTVTVPEDEIVVVCVENNINY